MYYVVGDRLVDFSYTTYLPCVVDYVNSSDVDFSVFFENLSENIIDFCRKKRIKSNVKIVLTNVISSSNGRDYMFFTLRSSSKRSKKVYSIFVSTENVYNIASFFEVL